jgi:2-polyprenyl-6-methoxyphenol hydroxylase-like FAD-dependent oxidoreductase
MRQAPSSRVIIIRAGPCGLILAIELGRRGIAAVVLEEKISPLRFPAANATQARTMEHFRRLGFADKVRAQSLPSDYPTDISYFTRLTSPELARFSLPSARAAARFNRRAQFPAFASPLLPRRSTETVRPL